MGGAVGGEFLNRGSQHEGADIIYVAPALLSKLDLHNFGIGIKNRNRDQNTASANISLTCVLTPIPTIRSVLRCQPATVMIGSAPCFRRAAFVAVAALGVDLCRLTASPARAPVEVGASFAMRVFAEVHRRGLCATQLGHDVGDREGLQVFLG